MMGLWRQEIKQCTLCGRQAETWLKLKDGILCSACEKMVDRGFWCEKQEKLLSLGGRFDLLSHKKIAARRSVEEVRQFQLFMEESERRLSYFTETSRSPGQMVVVDQDQGWFYLEADWQVTKAEAPSAAEQLFKPLAALFNQSWKQPVPALGFQAHVPRLRQKIKARFSPSLIFKLEDITGFHLDWIYENGFEQESKAQELCRADILLELSQAPVKFLRNRLQAETGRLELETRDNYREAAKPDLDYLYALTGLTAGPETRTYM
jgi:hypothetical protein